jgi:hypothetical protein
MPRARGGVAHRAQRELEGAGHEGRAVGLGEGHGLLGRELVAVGLGVVHDVAAGRLGVEPLAHVALGGVGTGGELGRRRRPGLGQRAVQAELVADDDQRGVHGRAELGDGLAEQRVEALLVNGLGGHGCSLRRLVGRR